MPYIQYQEISFAAKTKKVIQQANEIINVYAAQGYDLTLRQLYYQFVSRDLIRNQQSEYKRLGSIINDARLAGLIDWNHITDRTRNVKSNAHWESPSDIVSACAKQFQFDKWRGQCRRVEVWVEKDALSGVFDRVCRELDIASFSCRGYTSQSEMWSAAQRLRAYEKAGQEAIVFHFGDHDPSGIDMTRDIQERLKMFGTRAKVLRLALTMDQIRQYDPPPNPAKESDSRFEDYLREYGDESWELDALEPQVLANLVSTNLRAFRDEALWEKALARERQARADLAAVAARWTDVSHFVETDEDVADSDDAQ